MVRARLCDILTAVNLRHFDRMCRMRAKNLSSDLSLSQSCWAEPEFQD
jgi:hypothetical protein